jgi:hypothetical protein
MRWRPEPAEGTIMVELDDAMRRALLAREGPPAGARDEILASLRTRLGGPSDPGSDSGESGPGDLGGPSELATSQLTWAAKVAAATIGLTTSGLLTLKLGALAITAITHDGPPRAAPIEIVEPRALAESRAPLEVASPAPAKEDAPPRDPALGPSEPAASRKSSASAGESTLAAELVLVRAAKRTSADDPEAALELLDRHREQFPDGMLAPEREALRIEMLCELGRLPASCSEKVGMDSSAAGD